MMFSMVLQDPLLFQIAQRQFSQKNHNSLSWFMYAQRRLERYNIPSPMQCVAQNTDPKQWANSAQQTVTQYWQSVLVDRSQKYRSLRYLIIPDSNTPCLHGCWDTGKFDTLSNKRAITKLKLLTGTYILQGNRSVYNQHSVNATCPLCNSADETRHHFLIECSALSDVRRPYMERLLQYANDVNYSTDDLVALVLNPSETLKSSGSDE